MSVVDGPLQCPACCKAAGFWLDTRTRERGTGCACGFRAWQVIVPASRTERGTPFVLYETSKVEPDGTRTLVRWRWRIPDYAPPPIKEPTVRGVGKLGPRGYEVTFSKNEMREIYELAEHRAIFYQEPDMMWDLLTADRTCDALPEIRATFDILKLHSQRQTTLPVTLQNVGDRTQARTGGR